MKTKEKVTKKPSVPTDLGGFAYTIILKDDVTNAQARKIIETISKSICKLPGWRSFGRSRTEGYQDA
jgi:hypothetical protein